MLNNNREGHWGQSAGQGAMMVSTVTICVKPSVRSGPHQSKGLGLHLLNSLQHRKSLNYVCIDSD